MITHPKACYFGHVSCTRILLKAGADVGARDCYGNTPHQIFDDHVSEPVLDEVMPQSPLIFVALSYVVHLMLALRVT